MNSPNLEAQVDRWYSAVVVASLSAVVSALIVFQRLSSTGLRDDEAFTISTSWRSWKSFVDLTFSDETNGFFYAALLKIWMAIGGTSVSWLRLPSAISFIVTVALVSWMAGRLVGRTAGLISAAVIIFGGTALEFGQYIRFYAPVMALAAGSMVAWVSEIGRPRRSSLMAWAGISMALVACHMVAGALIAGQLAAIMLVEKDRRRWARRVGAMVPAVLLAGVVAVLVSRHDEGQAINQPLGKAAVADVLYALSGSGRAFGLVGYGLLGLVAAVGTVRAVIAKTPLGPRDAARLPHRTDVETYRAMLLAPWVIVVVGFALMLGASVFTNVTVGRYTAFMVPAVAAALGCGIAMVVTSMVGTSSVPHRAVAGVALPRATQSPWSARQTVASLVIVPTLIVGSIGATSGWRRWRDSARVDWAPVVQLVSVRSRPTDSVLFANDSMRLYFEYYRRKDPSLPLPSPGFPSGPWGGFTTGDHRYVPFGVDDVERALTQHQQVWLVVETGLLEDDNAQVRAVLERFHPSVVRTFPRTAVVFLVQREK